MEMDSPNTSKSTTNNAAESVPAQDSPVFSFISNLSPIQPVKAPQVTQGFPGLNSPPLVFTSPRLNPHSQATFLKRAKFPGLSAAKLSGQDEGCKNDAAVDASETLVAQMKTLRTNCIEKTSYSNSTMDDQIESPTGCPDQFLTDIVNMDSADLNISADSTINKSEQISQPPDAVTGSQGISSTPPPITRQSEEVLKEDTSTDVSAVETDIKQGDSVSEDRSPAIEPELPIDHALTNYDQDDPMAENVEVGQAGLLDQSSYLISGSMQIDEGDENFVEATEAASTKQVVKKVRNDSKAFQHRGIRRRCLQFEDAQRDVVSNQPVQNTSDSEGPTSQPLETQPTPINGHQADTVQPVLHPRNMNSALKIPKPSGIGLHLNSIVNSVQAGSGAIINVKSAQRGTFSIRGKRSVPMINSYPSDNSNSSSIFPPPVTISASPDDDRHESHASLAANFSTSLSTYIVKPSNKSVILNPVEDQSTPEESFCLQLPRKKSSDSSDGDGCKRCNCKKSKCLKLYCDCFAAGIYCADTCSCQGCYNRPEYEDTVLETRQQIESRNPLAFAPKIVQKNVEPLASSFGEDGTHFTPASARHKRGCNCKKSMCLKKYCECYQLFLLELFLFLLGKANVGCSDGCRCEGCKNVYGKKGEYGIMTKDVLNEEDTIEQTDVSFIEKMAESGIELYNTELCNPHNLTPLTPALQFLNNRDDASKAWFHSGKFFQSPESEYIAPYMMSPHSPRNSDDNAIMDQVSFDQEIVYDNAETGLHYQIPNPDKWANNSKTPSFSEDKHYSSAGSLCWRGSPNTPMAQSSGSKLVQVSEFDSDLSNLMQDDTPEILKDNPTPLNAVKVSSPNKKRVSPPHGRPYGFTSSLSAGLRTGRKFILKAVPSFPPLTPCIDSKNVQTSDSQNCTGKK
ncbi:hypothetical protein BUALT_Bualt10G0102000 [Buddleja alternifolia]|uniref:CRC domain-containing protein n=1 Tax=Buddleja alternifolia TaxID=168488 RepID=A0AAV6X8E7_9LAMI|nr:hypothetical protein BUALT_Bualt10G0102000 [Buddleja alternifolia]